MQLIWVAAAFAADFSSQDDPVQPAFTVHADDFPTAAGGPTALDAAVQAALRTWNVEGAAAVEVRYGGSGAQGDQGGGDALSTIDVGTGGGTAPYLLFPVDSGDVRTSCDIRLLTSNDDGAQTWSTVDGGTSGAWDAQTVLLQAVGSCLGLAPAVADSVMVPLATGTAVRNLGSADPAALQAIYGPAAVLIEAWSHFIIYDSEGGTGADGRGSPGETVLMRIQVVNDGTPAYDVSAHASFLGTPDLTFTVADAVHGDIPRGEFGVFSFEFRIDDCQPPSSDVTALVEFTDARGDVFPLQVDFPLQCAGDADTGGEEPRRCNCATGPSGGLFAALIGAAALRRRRSALHQGLHRPHD